MKYIKKFNENNFFDSIIETCEKYGIKNYEITDEGLVNVNGDVDLSNKFLRKLPLNFGHIEGNFKCWSNTLVNLEGAPKSVSKTFTCSYNNLTSLVGGPEIVGGDYICDNNVLTDLNGMPKKVLWFTVSKNKLTTLVGGPQKVRSMDCSKNKLTDFVGMPVEIDNVIYFKDNDIYSFNGIVDMAEYVSYITDGNPIHHIFKRIYDRFDIAEANNVIELFNDYDIIYKEDDGYCINSESLEFFESDTGLKFDLDILEKYYTIK